MQSQVLLTMVLEEEEEDVRHAHQVLDRAPRALELIMMVISLHIRRPGVDDQSKLLHTTVNIAKATANI